MAVANWLFAALLLLQTHFAASFLVPLDNDAQQEFGGLLGWIWPWSDGDSGLLGEIVFSSELPLLGIFIAITAATLFFGAALAVLNIVIPFNRWRILAGTAAMLSLVLMAGFFGATKVVPITLNIVVIWAAVTDWVPHSG